MSTVKSSKIYVKKFKCPYCDQRIDRTKLGDHIEKKHKELIPEGFTASRIAFNTINKKEVGHCIVCGSDTEWNEDKLRYERICNNPKCKKEYLKLVEERLKNKRGVTKKEMLSDPSFQDKMLKGRNISGTYKFIDGGSIDYVGSYEKNLLEFMDKYLHCKSYDIQSPGPTIEYIYEGKKHFWITDFLYIPYNLVFDVKDGGKNPNNREMAIYRAKQVAKEKALVDQGQYNYIRLTDNQFDQLIDIMLDLKFSLAELEGSYNQKMSGLKPIIRINESGNSEDILSIDTLSVDQLALTFNKILTDPYTYKKGDLSLLEKIVKNTYVTEYLTELCSLLRSSVAEYAEKRIEYGNYLESGKCTWVMQPYCEEMKANGITIEQVDAIGSKLAKLYTEVENKLKGMDNQEIGINVFQLTPTQLELFAKTINQCTNEGVVLDSFDLQYMVNYVM